MDGAPIGHHESGIAPVSLENLIEQPRIFARVGAIDLVECAHHASGPPLADRDLKCQKVRFAGGGAIYPYVEAGAIAFLVIQSEMFDGRDKMTALVLRRWRSPP